MYDKIHSRIDKDTLLDILAIWNGYLKRKVHIIACGGTALTLLNLKASTKDVDLIIPKENEYKYLVKLIKDLGYRNVTGTGWAKDKGFIFDLFVGKTLFSTELLESPLKEGNNFLFRELSFIYLGILNYYDLIISKLFRNTPVDLDDCLALLRSKDKDINIEKLKERFFETSSYDISDEKNKKNFNYFLSRLKDEGFFK